MIFLSILSIALVIGLLFAALSLMFHVHKLVKEEGDPKQNHKKKAVLPKPRLDPDARSTSEIDWLIDHRSTTQSETHSM